ncbi:MAG: hypothetical protein A2Y62_15620, partial [Candidatus Fischerbacteria bacterium RBG_13_37_8]
MKINKSVLTKERRFYRITSVLTMITGYNTEIKVKNKVFHIQTEDKGERNPIIETLIYVGGEIIDAYRTSYENLVKSGLDKNKLKSLMEEQHKHIIATIRQGKYTVAKIEEPQIDSPTNDDDPKIIEKEITLKSLDQVILEYLEKHSHEEKLLLDTKGDDNLLEGNPASLVIKSVNEGNNQPIPKAKIIIKIISTTRKPIPIFDGHTNDKGVLTIDF